MANERLRQAMQQAGLAPEDLADVAKVDVKTVYRWLGGRRPHPRYRTRLIRALGREEHELWPTKTPPATAKDGGASEIQGSWAHADDPGVTDWQALLAQTTEQVELLDYSLLDVLATDGTADTLAAKAHTGCQVRIVISAPDSIWVRARAHAIGQDEEDYVGRSPLAVEVETARGYLEPLTQIDGIELRQLYADPGYRILRFDDAMLISPHLHGALTARGPLLHLRRQHDGGLFDQFADHLDALTDDTAQPIEPAPGFYPDPRTHPDRYQPLTAERFDHLNDLRSREADTAGRASRPIEQVRAEIRRPRPGATGRHWPGSTDT